MMIMSDGLRDEQPWLKILRKTMKLNMVRCQFSVIPARGKLHCRTSSALALLNEEEGEFVRSSSALFTPAWEKPNANACHKPKVRRQQEAHTGSIWKCLNFWWWHSVSTNALGLLWLTRTRNNLHMGRKWDSNNKSVSLGPQQRRWAEAFMAFSSKYPSTCPCWWMMRWDSSLVILPWNHNCAMWMTVQTEHVLQNSQFKVFAVFWSFWSTDLSSARSDAGDCGNPARSFVDSSSEGDAVRDRKRGLVHELHNKVLSCCILRQGKVAQRP